MSSQPDPDAASDRFTTREHDNLSEVVEMLTMMERLRNSSLGDDEIAVRMEASDHEPPGGGSWNGPLVAKVLGVVSSVRTEQDLSAGAAALEDRVSQPSQVAPAPSQSEAGPEPTAPQTSLSPLRRRAESGPTPNLGYRIGDAGAEAIPATEIGPHRFDDGKTGPEQHRRRLLGGALLVTLIAVGGVVGATALGDDLGLPTTADSDSLASEPTPVSPTTETAGATGDAAAQGRVADAEGATSTSGSTPSAVDRSDPPGTGAADGADMMAIRVDPRAPEVIDPETGETIRAATATIRADGLLHLEGAFPTEAEAQRYIDGLAEVFGRDSIVESFEVNPAAPLPRASDVGLDKPVLFETGTATIEPSYIPFLDACGDVLRLNPQITMSISGFADSTGPEELNLVLSQRRAQAIYDYYRSIDVDGSQLQPLAFGEADPVADNSTAAGRQQNRRAMLRLLDVFAGRSGNTGD